MSAGDIVVYAIAFVAMALLFLFILNRWKDILKAMGWVSAFAAALAVCLVGLGIMTYVGITGWEYMTDRQTMQQCLTAHERRAKAYAAPDDYFGKQLRDTAAAEARKCAEFAAKKQAASASSK